MRTLILSLLLVAVPAWAQEKTETTTKTDTTTATKKPKRSELMDINTASADQLKTLPGMTDDIAKKVIAARPYTGKDQLLKQNIVDKDEYAKIRPLIIAKQPKAAKPEAAPAAAPPSGANTKK